jgi:hypothetical protein
MPILIILLLAVTVVLWIAAGPLAVLTAYGMAIGANLVLLAMLGRR